MTNKRKLPYSKSSIQNYIIITLLETKKISKQDIMNLGISRQTMYKYIMEIRVNLFDLGIYHLNISSFEDYYCLS